jgi:phage gp29-like protein
MPFIRTALKTLTDWFGRETPVNPPALEQSQTSTITTTTMLWAGHPARGLAPAQLAAILEAAERGDLTQQAELADDMEERDAHLFCELQKRKQAVLSLAWDIIAPRNASADEERATAELKDWVETIPDLEDVLKDMLDAILKGYAGIELGWQLLGNIRLPQQFTLQPASWFCLDRATLREIRLRTPGQIDGESLWPFGWILHVHKAKSGYIARSSLARILVWPYLFKNYSTRDLAEFLEIYGLPLRLGKYPIGAKKEDKATLLKAVAALGHNAAGIIPETMKVEFVEAVKATSDPFLAMTDWAERSESKAIVGQTLSAEAQSTGLGSGVAALQAEVRREFVNSDAKQVARTLTQQLLFPLLALNRGWMDPRRCPRWVFKIEETEDIATYSDALPKLVGVGMPIPVSWAQQRLGIPAPQDSEPVLAAAVPAATASAPVLAKASQLPAGQDAIDVLADEATQDWQPQLGPVIDPVQAAADAASDYDDFLRRLDALSGDLDARVIVQKLAEATFKARGMGDATDATR